MSLSRAQIEEIQDKAAAGELRVAGVEPAQLVFLAQMALEGNDEAWAAVTQIAGGGGYGQEQRGPDQALPVSRRMI